MDKQRVKALSIYFVIFILTIYLTMAYVIRGKKVVVPSIKGFNVEEARKIVVSKGLYLKEGAESFNETIPDGCVMAQDPIEGAYVKEGRTVYVTVSRGLKMVTVPDIREQNIRQAKILLRQALLNLGMTAKITTRDTPEGFILAQTPQSNALTKRNGSVNILASAGEKEVFYVMPNLMGKKQDIVRKALYSARLNVGNVSYKTVAGFDKGAVVNQFPLPGAMVKKESSVDLTVNYAENEKQYRLLSILYTVPKAGLAVKRVRLIILDNDGSREIYNDMARSGSTIEKSVRASGAVILQVSINNELLEERPYE